MKNIRKKIILFFPEDIVKYIMTQIISPFKYMHKMYIMHRDIRLENIMVAFSNDKDKEDLNILKTKIKIIDFGLATQGLGKTVFTIFDEPEKIPPLLLKKYHESLASKANIKMTYDLKIDIWALGAICYQMAIGRPVFDSKSLDDLVRKVEEGTYLVPNKLSREIVSFLNCMLRYDPAKIKTAEELSKHPFIVKNITEFHRMNLKKTTKQIVNIGMKFNIKKSNNIWSIFSEEDKIKLSSIKEGNENNPNVQLYKNKTLAISSKIILPTSANTNVKVNNYSQYSIISNNSNMSNTHCTPKFEVYQNNYLPNNQNQYQGQIMPNNPNLQNQNIREEPLKSFHSANSSTIIFPSQEYYNQYQINQNNPRPINQANYGNNIVNNNNGHVYNNPQSQIRPMDNIEVEDENVCFIM